MEKAYYPALTGVRALAAYMVFMHHFIPVQWENKYFNLTYFFGELHIGVTFFFVLSGFLIHNRYHNFDNLNVKNYFNYFSSRVARIFPIFFILTTITLILNYFTENKDEGLLGKNLGIWLLNISLVKGFFSGLNFSGIPQSWSLTVEFCFYAIAPFLFFKFKNVKILPLVSICLLAIGFGFVFIFQNMPLHHFFGDYRFMLCYSFFGRSFEFFLGCYLSANLFKWRKNKFKNGLFTYSGVFLIIITIYILSLLRMPMIYGVHTAPGLIINNFILPFCILIFFKGLLIEKTVVSSVFSSSLFQILGKSSYAFYLIHVGFIQKFLFHFVTQQYSYIFILLNIVSIFAYHLIEEPLYQKVKTWLLNFVNQSSDLK